MSIILPPFISLHCVAAIVQLDIRWFLLIEIFFLDNTFFVTVLGILSLESNCYKGNFASCENLRSLHVKYSHEIRVKNALSRVSSKNDNMNFTWKGFYVNIVWKSCELSHEFQVKLASVKLTWKFFHFIRFTRNFLMILHVKLT